MGWFIRWRYRLDFNRLRGYYLGRMVVWFNVFLIKGDSKDFISLVWVVRFVIVLVLIGF